MKKKINGKSIKAAIEREDYERAAVLRDQIKQLKEERMEIYKIFILPLKHFLNQEIIKRVKVTILTAKTHIKIKVNMLNHWYHPNK